MWHESIKSFNDAACMSKFLSFSSLERKWLVCPLDGSCFKRPIRMDFDKFPFRYYRPSTPASSNMQNNVTTVADITDWLDN
jgi:hypothetical protein